MKKVEKIIFWIDNFKNLNGKYNAEEDYWLQCYNENNQRRLTDFFSSVLNVDELKSTDIIVINFKKKKFFVNYMKNDGTRISDWITEKRFLSL